MTLLNSVYCRDCGKEISANALACPHCGAQQKSTGGKTQVVAFLLAWFFGVLGIHKFYLGQTWQGIIMLVLTFTFFGIIITGLWAFIDGIRYMLMSEEEFNKNYCK